MILVDSNILMYAAGAAHPNKAASVHFLERVARGEIDAAVDAEVLQEVMHRYRSLRRWTDGRRVYALARDIFPYIVPITREIVDRAKALMDADGSLSARDAVHAAVTLEHGMKGICTFDQDFERIPGCVRIAP
jgi:predicted nucleic acid-binding protein